MSIQAYIVGRETGEVLDEIKSEDSYKIFRGNPGAITCPLPFTSFVKVNFLELAELSKELSSPEIKILSFCISFLGYSDNCIKTRRGRPLNILDISLYLGVSERTVLRSVNKLIDMDILCFAENGEEKQLYLCPFIAGRGNRQNKVLQTMFRHYKIRSQDCITWETLIKRGEM